MESAPTYRDVLVPLDASDRAALALPHAGAVVAAGGTIHLVRILEMPGVPNPMYAHYGPVAWSLEEKQRHEREALGELETVARAFTAPQGVSVRCHVITDVGEHVAERICQAARDLRVDLVCMSSHGRRGLKRVLLGSVAEGVVRRCSVPTLVVRVPERELAAG